MLLVCSILKNYVFCLKVEYFKAGGMLCIHLHLLHLNLPPSLVLALPGSRVRKPPLSKEAKRFHHLRRGS